MGDLRREALRDFSLAAAGLSPRGLGCVQKTATSAEGATEPGFRQTIVQRFAPQIPHRPLAHRPIRIALLQLLELLDLRPLVTDY
jgi:hypothetical protein